MSTPNDYSITPEQVKAAKTELDNLIAQGASKSKIYAAQLAYDKIIETWEQTFSNCILP